MVSNDSSISLEPKLEDLDQPCLSGHSSPGRGHVPYGDQGGWDGGSASTGLKPGPEGTSPTNTGASEDEQPQPPQEDQGLGPDLEYKPDLVSDEDLVGDAISNLASQDNTPTDPATGDEDDQMFEPMWVMLRNRPRDIVGG